MKPRFRIRRVAELRGFGRWVIADHTRPLWIGRAATFEDALDLVDEVAK